MSKSLIPNTFQHPNAYIDWLSYYLTGEEEKVLNKAIREIIGWHNKIESRQANIALSIFLNGKKKDGEQVCMGCGLSLDAVRRALASLHDFNILVKVGDPDPRDGQLYQLVEEVNDIDWDGLQTRREEWDGANRNRTKNARTAQESARQEGVLSDSSGPSVGQNPSHLSDSNKETQIETQKEISGLRRRPDPLPPIEEGYLIKYYVGDDENVDFDMGRKKKGPWRLYCPNCQGKTVTVEKMDSDPTSCSCGMHEFVLLGKRPPAKFEREHPAVDAYFGVAFKARRGKLDDEWKTRIIETVGVDPERIAYWKRVIAEAATHNYDVRNVPNLLKYMSAEYMDVGKMPGDRDKRKDTTADKPVKQQEEDGSITLVF